MIKTKLQMANQEQEGGGAGGPNLKIVSESNMPASLEYVMDIHIRVRVELGRTKILVQDLIKLHKGSVIELQKVAGEALEVLVNDKVVAKGEVIVTNDKFGVRLTDIVSSTQRIRQLGEMA